LIEATRKIKVGPTDREAQPDMGALITRQHRDRVLELIEPASKEGAKIPGRRSRRESQRSAQRFFVGATILDHVQNGMTVAKEEIFGPVLNVMHMEDLDAAIELANKSMYGNGASIFTRSPARPRASSSIAHQLRHGRHQHRCARLDGLVPVQRLERIVFRRPAHAGREGVQFFTQQKVTTSRWFSYGEGDIWHTGEKT
jgi:malonate-semialdehyde dehydrogenase (acetylating) / methylmalonate-semialdehyde dehydrogenase